MSDYKRPDGTPPESGRFVRVITQVVVEGPVELVDDPSLLFPEDVPGEWVRIPNDLKVECHWIMQEDGSFQPPPPVQPPAPEDPVQKLASFLSENPDVDAMVQAGKKPPGDKTDGGKK